MKFVEHRIETLYGPRTFRRAKGEALHPEREPLELLRKWRQDLGEYHFASQFQQNPAPLGGGIVKIEHLRRYRPAERPEKFDLVFQSWDSANKATELSDFSVCTTWAAKDHRLYLLDVVRLRLNYPELRAMAKQLAELHHPQNIIVEDNI